MYLKPAVNQVLFLDRVSKCQGEVFLYTQENDCINLKSELSKYIFLFLCEHPDISAQSTIVCECDADYIVLAEYLQNK